MPQRATSLTDLEELVSRVVRNIADDSAYGYPPEWTAPDEPEEQDPLEAIITELLRGRRTIQRTWCA